MSGSRQSKLVPIVYFSSPWTEPYKFCSILSIQYKRPETNMHTCDAEESFNLCQCIYSTKQSHESCHWVHKFLLIIQQYLYSNSPKDLWQLCHCLLLFQIPLGLPNPVLPSTWNKSKLFRPVHSYSLQIYRIHCYWVLEFSIFFPFSPATVSPQTDFSNSITTAI